MAHEFEKKWRSKDVQLQENVDFSVMLLNERVLSGLTTAGYKKPSPIQLEAIPVGRVGKDLLVQAKSGTGKTLVFTIIALEQLKRRLFRPQVLVLAPTREIATQICNVVQSVGSTFTKLKCFSFIGGLSFLNDRENAPSCQIAIGTPGRVRQLVKSGHLPTNWIRLLVFDEADQLLQGTFKLEIDDIFSALPKDKQVIATSATYPTKLRKTIFQYFREPHLACLNSKELALLGIVHYAKLVKSSLMPMLAYRFKLDVLQQILNSLKFSQCLIFCNGIARVEYLCQDVRKLGYSATYISSAKEQVDRLKAMDRLKSFKCKVFISSDVSSRGIDAENVDLVINFDVPYATETYLHRVGRAGRYGSIGVAITLINETEIPALAKVESQGAFKSYKLPDPLPHDLIQNPSLVEYSIPESMFPETEDGESNVNNNNDEVNTDKNESNVNGMPFNYNFLDFNEMANKSNKKQNQAKVAEVTEEISKTYFSTKIELESLQLDAKFKNQINNTESQADILITDTKDENSGSHVVPECKVFKENAVNNAQTAENREMSSKNESLINNSDSVGEQLVDINASEKNCNGDLDTKYRDGDKSKDVNGSPQKKSMNNVVAENNVEKSDEHEKENSCEIEDVHKSTGINRVVDNFIQNYENNKDVLSAAQNVEDEIVGDESPASNVITLSMLEKLKRDRSNYLYKVFKCYQEDANKEERLNNIKSDEIAEESINANENDSVPVNNSNAVSEPAANQSENNGREISGVACGTNIVNQVNMKNPAKDSTVQINPLIMLNGNSSLLVKDSEFDSESTSNNSTSISLPTSRHRRKVNFKKSYTSSEELSIFDNSSESSCGTSSMTSQEYFSRERYSCGHKSYKNKYSTPLRKSVHVNKNTRHCTKGASCTKCSYASQCCVNLHAAENTFPYQDTERPCIPKQKHYGVSCEKCSIPKSMNCYLPSCHRCHLPYSCNCTYINPAVCNMWHDTFMYQWFHVQGHVNSMY